MKQFDGLNWLTRPPYFTTGLRRCWFGHDVWSYRGIWRQWGSVCGAEHTRLAVAHRVDTRRQSPLICRLSTRSRRHLFKQSCRLHHSCATEDENMSIRRQKNRRSSVKLFKAGLHLYSVNTTLGQRSIQYKGCVLWNKLPSELQEPMSVNRFKSLLKLHLQNWLLILVTCLVVASLYGLLFKNILLSVSTLIECC